ncbi:MAG: hypothetical protein RJB01_802 [Actinomycetota bacterium]
MNTRLRALDRLLDVRAYTESLAQPLSPEDQQVQSMPDCSPTKWHRAHTTWFFEEFILTRSPEYRVCNPNYQFLFNSYYETVGERQPRPERGMITRPSVDEIGAYRRYVDDALSRVLESDEADDAEVEALVTLGINHEQQHQELLLMDAKNLLSRNPLHPVYSTKEASDISLEDAIQARSVADITWSQHPGGLREIGYAGDGFHFDNEGPRHTEYLRPFELADRLVTCGQWLDFMEDGGYQRHELWHMEGWVTVKSEGWQAPLYWVRKNSGWHVFTLNGLEPINELDPVVHVSWFEAEAFARWAGCRLPTEAEWEVAASRANAQDTERASDVHPHYRHNHAVSGPSQFFGEVWQWTSSPYTPYPGFAPVPGAVGEYNGKFMVNQYVLRGSACITPVDHSRTSYRNFFPASSRWAFSGLRLARDAADDDHGGDNEVRVFLDESQWAEHLETQTRDGLNSPQPSTPPVWFYDKKGSQLFERITELDEYYVTNAERTILVDRAHEIAALSGARVLVELGSGTSDKTRILIDALRTQGTLDAFVPVDCSESILRDAVTQLRREFDDIDVRGIVGDFTVHLGELPAGDPRMIAFLGSTIGNFEPKDRRTFLQHVADSLSEGDSLLLGTDLVKDVSRLENAYDDAQGITAEFNLNALDVMNRSLGTDFERSAFRHEARWVPEHSRIEMRLVAQRDVDVEIPGIESGFSLKSGEWIRTEVSTKFTKDQVQAELSGVGLTVAAQWTDPAGDFLLTLAQA